MDEFDDKEIAALLRLKRYEQPPPEYFENFLHEFHRRIGQPSVVALHPRPSQLIAALIPSHGYQHGRTTCCRPEIIRFVIARYRRE